MNATAKQHEVQSFYSEIERLLLERLKNSDDPTAIRFRLLDLYFETNRSADFLRQARIIARSMAGSRSRDETWPRIAMLGHALMPEESLFEQGEKGRETRAAANEEWLQRRFGDRELYAAHFERLAKQCSRLTAPSFLVDFDLSLWRSACRPSSLYHARRLSAHVGGARIFFKREDESPPDQLLTICILGQAKVAARLQKNTLVTGSVTGQKGVLTASIAASVGMKSIVFMTEQDIERNPGCVLRIRLVGGEVRPVESDVPDARHAALGYWASDPECFMAMGLDGAPHPYTSMLADFTGALGRKCLRQLLTHRARPDLVVAQSGNNPHALSAFPTLLGRSEVRLACVEPRRRLSAPVYNELISKPPIQGATPFHPSDLLSVPKLQQANSRREGMEHPSMDREHAWLRATGRVEYAEISEDAVREAINDCASLEGIVPTIESAHVVAYAAHAARSMGRNANVVAWLGESLPGIYPKYEPPRIVTLNLLGDGELLD